jgi:hypothetical protein
LAVSFALAVVIYVAGFWGIERRRVVKGPWVVEFVSDAAARPSLRISQRKLGISEELDFPNAQVERPNISERVFFDGTRTNLPFGEMLLQDALYLPGTVTMRVCGHQVEVLPRTLIVDNQERPWRAGEVVVITDPPSDDGGYGSARGGRGR